MEITARPGAPNSADTQDLSQTTLEMDGRPFGIIYGPDPRTATDIALAVVRMVETNNAFKQALQFIAGIKNKDGRPVASAVIARRALERAQRRPNG
jgi:hypothetical protein